MKQLKRTQWPTEPLATISNDKAKLTEALRRYQIQNQLLWQLLDKHSIEVPKEVIDYTEIELVGEEAHIYTELQSIQGQIDDIMHLLHSLLLK